MRSLQFLLLISIFLMISCTKNDDTTANSIQFWIEKDSLDYTLQDSGIYYHFIHQDESQPGIENGNIVVFDYIAYNKSGVLMAKQDSVFAVHGENAILPIAFESIFPRLHEGDTAMIYVPSHLAFLDYTFEGLLDENDPIKYYVILRHFYSYETFKELEEETILTYIETKNTDDPDGFGSYEIEISEGIYFQDRSDDTENGHFSIGQTVNVRFKSYTLESDVIFDNTISGDPLTFVLGSDEVTTGLFLGTYLTEKGQSSLFIVPSQLAYKSSVAVLPPLFAQDMVDNDRIPSYATLVSPLQPLIFELSLQNN